MTRKIRWLVVSCLTVAALWLAACAPAVTEEPVTQEPVTQEPVTQEPVTKEPVTAPEGTEMVRDVNGKLVPKPQYGGVLVEVRTETPRYWNGDLQYWQQPIYEGLLHWDWARGPAGTGEWNGLYINMIDLDMIVGALAESWEVPDANTMVFHIRKGVRFQEESLMKGREMDAYDVEYSLRRSWTVPTAFNAKNYAASRHFINASINDGIVATDKWTVVIKAQEDMLGSVLEMAGFHFGAIIGPEIEDYDMNDWRNAGGTGPVAIVDYVSGSAETYKKNPNYWAYDPLHPQNKLPYVDGVKILQMEDPSTRLAALRTGRVDLLGGRGSRYGALEWEDAAAVMKSNPELGYKIFEPDVVPSLYMRNDRPEQPWYDVNVRRALAMAIDNQALVDDLYGGHATLFAWPVVEGKQELSPDLYIPLEEYPEVVQKLFGYYPEEAKQLLVDAGYPDGFTAEVITQSKDVDLLALIADYWKKNLNVTMDIQVRESAVYTSIGSSLEHKEMYMSQLNTSVGKMKNIAVSQASNFSVITDPYPDYILIENIKYYFDTEKRIKVLQEAYPYFWEQAWFIQLPNPYVYTFWQPWLHNYEGAWFTEYGGSEQGGFQEFVWLDRDLKEQITGRR